MLCNSGTLSNNLYEKYTMEYAAEIRDIPLDFCCIRHFVLHSMGLIRILTTRCILVH